MRKIENDPFYDVIDKYDRCVIDYCLIKADSPNLGYTSHKDAVLFAMNTLYEGPWELNNSDGLVIDENTMQAVKIDSNILLYVPNIVKTDAGTYGYDADWKNDNEGNNIPYWYAFLEPPQGTGPVEPIIRNGNIISKRYGVEDLKTVNDALFPQGTDDIEVYEWSTDWSNYFDAGHEWWGANCYSIYDQKLDRFVVIMASATD